MPTGAFGAVRPVGLSFPPLPRRAPPIHEAMGGYAAPKAPAGQSCLDDELFPWLAMPIWHWSEQKNGKWYRVKLRCRWTNGIVLAGQVNAELRSCLRRPAKALWFSTLLTTAIRRYLLIIRKLAVWKSAKR